jgi:hypothetical protein
MLLTPHDLLTAHGAPELAQLTTPEGAPVLDHDLLIATIDAGDRSAWTLEDQALADAALATLQAAVDLANARTGRIASGRVLSAEDELVLLVAGRDLARARLYDDARLPDDHPVSRRDRDAQRFLERVASGLEPFGQPLIGTPGLPAIAADAPARQFDRTTLADYG